MMVARTSRPPISHLSTILLCLVSLSKIASGSDLCPDLSSVAPGECVKINDWSEFLAVTASSSGQELIVCPFDITKGELDDPVVISEAISLRCLYTDETNLCVIRGNGTHIRVETSEDTLFQGFSFQESDDHAVHVVSTEGSEKAVHTFCTCSFMRNERLKTDRGGVFKTEKQGGTVNVVGCLFANNYSVTYGTAIYSRTNIINVIRSNFVENIAAGLGGAIYVAADGDIMIQQSNFNSNFGRNGYSVVVHPKDGPSVWTDGFDNEMFNSGPCDGYWNIVDSRCERFVSAPSSSPTSTPSPTGTPEPTSSPTLTAAPTTVAPSVAPSVSLVPTSSPTTSFAPTSVEESLCDYEPDTGDCISVSSWMEFKSAIESATDDVVFCGRFRIRKPAPELLVINRSIEIRCNSLCTVYGGGGTGTLMAINGEDSQVKIYNMKFTNADASAVQVLTSSPKAATTFCGCEFWNNALPEGSDGAALYLGEEAGVVNVMGGYFSANKASKGGAIFSQAYKLNIVGSKFLMRRASGIGSAIFVGRFSHLLIRSTIFSMNNFKSTSEANYAVAVNPEGVSQTEIAGVSVDAGLNVIQSSGDCAGIFHMDTLTCREFEVLEGKPIHFPYIPGDLSIFDERTGLKLSTGLTARVIAETGLPVQLTSDKTKRSESLLAFHGNPDGAATFPLEDGGWVYMSNSRMNNKKGGVYAVNFDSDGEVRSYAARLEGTTRNSNGGVTPWNTLVSCEEYPGGQCWQLDPLNVREPEKTILGGPGGGYLEAFAYDFRNLANPKFFVSEDSSDGALRCVRPSPGVMLMGSSWDLLTNEVGSIREFLVLDPGAMTFSWSSSVDEGRASAAAHYPHSEGLSHRDGILYMSNKPLGTVFALNLDTLTYVAYNTSEGILVGDGEFEHEADQLVQLTDQVLYMAENGGSNPGVYGRDQITGNYFAILEAFSEDFNDDDVTGIAFNPDWTIMYFCFETKGIMFEIKREDGLPFERADA